MEEWPEREKLLAEKEVLGFYLHSHPLAEYENKLSTFRTHTTDKLADIKDRELGGINVGGHTDTAGPSDYNMQLSIQRANTVATELIKAGVPATKIEATGFGQTDLAVETPDGVANAANRRVEVGFTR